MTEEENKEFEEFLEWKAEKERKEEENKVKQKEAERQVKVNAQMPQVEEEKSMEFDNKQDRGKTHNLPITVCIIHFFVTFHHVYCSITNFN